MKNNNANDIASDFKQFEIIFKKAKYHALKEVLTKIKKNALKKIAKDLKIKQKIIKDNIIPSPNTLKKEDIIKLLITTKGGRLANFISDYFFNKRPKVGPRVRVKPESDKGNGAKIVKHAFYREGKYSGKNVFISAKHYKGTSKKQLAKITSGKLKIIPLYTTVSSDIAQNLDFDKEVTEEVLQKMDERFEHHLFYFLNKERGKK